MIDQVNFSHPYTEICGKSQILRPEGFLRILFKQGGHFE